MSDENWNEAQIDQLFAEARKRPVVPSDAVTQRVLADAEAAQAGFAHERVTAPDVSTGGMFSQLRSLLGGWPGIGGLAAACAVGVWIGFAPPEGIPDPFQAIAQTGADLDMWELDQLALVMDEG